MADSPLTQYRSLVASGEITADTAQAHAVQALEALWQKLRVPPKSRLRLFRAEQEAPKGIYLWGGVGRGKTMLMDMFFRAVPFSQKRRVHFHAFMLDVHKRLHAWRQLKTTDDLLPRVVAELAECKLICLDEMQVTDVTDAMILARLFTLLMDEGVTVVFTSNRPPRELYQGGLQREQFLKFVEVVEDLLNIVELASPTDYRLQQLLGMECVYKTPLGSEADEFLANAYARLCLHAPSHPVTLEILGRNLIIERACGGIGWMTFDELCVRPLGAQDYIAIAGEFHTLLLQAIPRLSPEKRNEAKRFVTLIDTLYDHHVKLVCTAAAAPDDLYPKGDGSFEFARTASRLHEMQSEPYLAASHEGTGEVR